MSTTKEDFCAMEMFFSKLAAARVDPEIRPLTGGRPQPRPRPAYGLESVCIVMEDINGDYRMLQALRHLPNLGRLIVHGSSQWVNNVVNGDQSTLGQVSLPPYYLTDLWALIESCPVLEDMCLLNLGLDGKEGEMEMEEEEDHDKQHVAECFEKVEDVIVQSPPALLGSVEEAKVSTLVPKQSRKGRLKALTMQIPEERPHVYQTLLQRTGFSLQKLDLTLVDWCMNRLQATERLEALVRLCPRLEVLALRFRPDVVVQAIHRHKQEIQKSALSEEDAQGKKVNERAYVEATNKKVEKWSQSFRYNSAPVSYCGVDVARLAEAFPETLLSLELVDVRMETTNMVQVDPLRSPAVSGIKSLKILYRHTACPIRELEHILATFGHLTRLEMGVPHAECVRGSGFVPILLTPTMQDHDTMMQALSKSHRWACQETLQFLDGATE
ncbi:hypothetical protein BGZ94_007640 [Podila epigama]|nr:hypothetical protein BGZ94_007640 [Podila epigama]